MMKDSPFPNNSTAVYTGVRYLDELLGGLFIGDNVIWYDDAGSLAGAFCHKFLQSSQNLKKDLIYVSFDRSPKNLLDKLGPLAVSDRPILTDCFTYGKGGGLNCFSEILRRSEHAMAVSDCVRGRSQKYAQRHGDFLQCPCQTKRRCPVHF